MLTSDHNCLTCCIYLYFLCHLLTQRKARQVCMQPAGSPVNRLILAVFHPCDSPSPLPSVLLLMASYTGAILLPPPALPNSSCSSSNNTAACRIPFHCFGKHSHFTPVGGTEFQAPGKEENKTPKQVRSLSFGCWG